MNGCIRARMMLFAMLGLCAACGEDAAAPATPSPESTATTNSARCGRVPNAMRTIDGHPLGLDRVDAAVTADTMRVKPYTALMMDFRRIFGTLPDPARNAASTFSVVPERWYIEPQIGAVSLYTVHRIAFAGCLSLMPSHERWASLPTRDTAAAQCGEWAFEFWGHRAEQAQMTACEDFLTDDAQFTGATPPVLEAGPRWAAGCAMMLSAPEFLSY